MTLVSDSYKPIAPDNRPGYVCPCKLGSPKPGKVILVSKLHDRTCWVRHELARGCFENGDLLGF